MTDMNIIDIDNAADASVDLVGTKGWNLAQLRAHGFPTPEAYIVTTTSYDNTLAAGRIEHQLDQIWEAARYAEPARIHVLARKARHLISELRIRPADAAEIVRRTDTFRPGAEYAVRSSVPPTAVSGPECAGVHSSFTNVVGPDQVVSRIHGCWASLFGERALAMRRRGLGDARPTMAVVVQPMVAAAKSGIAVPFDNDSDILIEATFGLGEPLVSGTVEPDRYVVDALSSITRSATIGRKQIILPADAHGGHAFAPADRQLQRVLDDAEALAVAQMCSRVSASFGGAHEIEWAVDGSGLVVLQARPADPSRDITEPTLDRMLSGRGIGLGTASGPVRIVRDTNDLAAVRPGDVIVSARTIPEWKPHLERAAAIVTDDGDEHSHAARVARECGIPAVVSTSTATTDLDDGTMITVDALRGWILPKRSA
jgi:pyruvate,water dikinase